LPSFTKLELGLNEIIKLSENGKFPIKLEEEDCHTAIENYLTKKIGIEGKKIHTCRSRNDQVLTAIRLFEKEELSDIKKLVQHFIESLNKCISKYGSINIPGYTHMQKAMPTDITTWLSSFKSAAQDNLTLLDAIYEVIDQSPLGSAAGFGVHVFKLNNVMTADFLKFKKVMKNPMYAQLSRGKFEAEIISMLSNVLFDLNKLASDLILFNVKEFNFIDLPKELCTGSSIMPQKKNPDVLEICHFRLA